MQGNDNSCRTTHQVENIDNDLLNFHETTDKYVAQNVWVPHFFIEVTSMRTTERIYANLLA